MKKIGTVVSPGFNLLNLNLMSRSHKMITDSREVQKEAYILKAPCIIIRSETEWVETLESGWNCLIDPAANNISESIRNFVAPSNMGIYLEKM